MLASNPVWLSEHSFVFPTGILRAPTVLSHSLQTITSSEATFKCDSIRSGYKNMTMVMHPSRAKKGLKL